MSFMSATCFSSFFNSAWTTAEAVEGVELMILYSWSFIRSSKIPKPKNSGFNQTPSNFQIRTDKIFLIVIPLLD